ncbi:MAG TPA: glycosyl hydrolase family 65 protein [Miltoncostaeaceae bacterium]|nr:glycosyl hydrolase family 65 protein [Miltoncostaeaceae bacterium]
MIADHVYGVEPWAVRERSLDLDVLSQSESVLALSNGHIGLRGTLDEGEPHGLPGTYLNGFYEIRPLPYPEGGFGYPESGQSVINVTDGKIIRLLVEDEPFDVRYGVLNGHERVLDLRDGVLRRTADWTSPAGTRVLVTSTRLVSFTQRAIAAIEWTVEPVDRPATVVVQSELVANEPLPETAAHDPRAAAELGRSLVGEYHAHDDARAVLMHTTAHSGLRMAAGMDHHVQAPMRHRMTNESSADLARLTVAAKLEAGERLRLVKFLAYGWSAERSAPAIRAQVEGAMQEAFLAGWHGLIHAQREYLDEYWRCADIEVEGDDELQQAARFALFHVLQAGARAENRAIPAKGLTGPGYDGHAFWDTETYVLPPLTYTRPEAAADELRWRHSTLDFARERARTLGLGGAAFPWRTIRGHECSGYWPAGTAAFHVGADIAAAVVRYHAVTGDDEFARDVGVELLVETARLWASLGHHDVDGSFRIDGVTGPDEYTAIVDNNVFTNMMAQQNLRAAADAVERWAERGAQLEVGSAEVASWRRAADAMTVPWDPDLGVHPQSEGFTRHARWDFEGTPPERYPLLLHFPYFQLYRTQVVKQADLVMALYLRGDAFTDEQKLADFDYYEALTVRDSSLSACIQAVVAAEVGHLELAYAYTVEAALIDLRDLASNTHDGLHIASLAGTWLALVGGFGGLRDHDGQVAFAPRLPPRLRRMTFGIRLLGPTLRVEVTKESATYRVTGGGPLDIVHHGEGIVVAEGEQVTRPIPPAPVRTAPSQPPGREPVRRKRDR